MMKRILSMVLAMAMAFSLISIGSVNASSITSQKYYDEYGNYTGWSYADEDGNSVSSVSVYDAEGNYLGYTCSYTFSNGYSYSVTSDENSKVFAVSDGTGYTYDYNTDTYQGSSGFSLTGSYGESISASYADGTSVTTTCDSDGNVTSVTYTGNDGYSYSYSFDIADYTLSESGEQISSTTGTVVLDTVMTVEPEYGEVYVYKYTYDSDGNVLACSGLSNYGVDCETVYSYDTVGNMLTSVCLCPNSASMEEVRVYSYDGNNLLTSEVGAGPGNTMSWQKDYTYNAAGQLVSSTSLYNQLMDYGYTSTTTYTYDANGNLTEVVETTTFDWGDDEDITETSVSYTYTYDANGNLLSEVCDGTDGYVHTYEYDEAGNLVEESFAYTSYSWGAYTTQYTYEDGSLLSAVSSEGSTTTYSYDSYGNLATELTYKDGELTCMTAYTYTTIPEEEEEEIENPFTDVQNSSSWYYNAVMWAVEKGITNGTTDTTFSPTKDCTRAEIVTFLWRAAGCPEPTSTENPFTDVKSGKYYYKAVLWAVEKGITTGTSSTTFSPNASCTRAEAVTFIYRYAKSPTVSVTDKFTDVSSSKWYTSAVAWAVENSITSGTSSTTFSPNTTCSRAMIVTFLYRYCA